MTTIDLYKNLEKKNGAKNEQPTSTKIVEPLCLLKFNRHLLNLYNIFIHFFECSDT